MNLPASATGSFPVIVVTFADSVNADFALLVQLEVVYSPITAFGGDLQRCSREFGHTFPSGLALFPFLRTPSWSCWCWCQWPKSCNPAKDGPEQSSRNSHLGHLKRHIPRVGHDFGANLHQLLPQRCQRPVLYTLG